MPVWCLPRHYSTKQQHATGAWVEHPVKGRAERLIFSYAQSMSRLLQFRMDVWISERYKLPEPWRMLRLIHGECWLASFHYPINLFPSDYEPSSSAFRILYRQCTCTWVASAWFDASDLFHHRLRWPTKRTPGVSKQIPFKGLLNDQTLASCYRFVHSWSRDPRKWFPNETGYIYIYIYIYTHPIDIPTI